MDRRSYIPRVVLVMTGAALAYFGADVRVAAGATITVQTTRGGTGGPDCTLRDAVTAANDDVATGGCPAGSGADTIVLTAGAKYTLSEVDNITVGPNGLPLITSEIDIEGNGARIERSREAPAFRLLYAGPAAMLTLRSLTLANGLTGNDAGSGHSFDGGGIYNAGGTIVMEEIQGVSGNATATVTRGGLGLVYRFSGNGGGIYNAGSLTIRNSRVDANRTGDGDPVVADGQSPGSAGAGGGIYNIGSLTVQNSLIVQNRTGSGGGLGSGTTYGFGRNGGSGGGIYNLGSMTVQNSQISSNEAGGGGFEDYGGPGGHGGGIFNGGGGDLTVLDTTLDHNDAGWGGSAGFQGGAAGSGGGIYNEDGTVVLIRSTVSENSAGPGGRRVFSSEAAAGGSGGGVFSKGGSLTIENSTVSGNETGWGGSAGAGGGVAALSVRVTSSTITSNRTAVIADNPSSGNGGGIDSPDISIDDTILAGNTASGAGADCHGEIKRARFDVIGDLAGCAIPADATGLLIGQAPQIGPLQHNGGPTQTQTLCTGKGIPDSECEGPSPAIDAASAEGCLATDQRGAPRPVGPGCDIGAYESGSLPPASCVGDCDQNGAVTVDELVRAVNVALGNDSVICRAADDNHSGTVSIDELVRAVNAALDGCVSAVRG